MQIVVHTTCCRCQQQHFARPPLGTLQPSHFLQQIFARICKQNPKTYLQQKYLPLHQPTAAPTKFSPGIIFTTRCRSHCCGGTQLLSYSVPRRKFRYVLFSLRHFWGTDYWQFFGVFVRHWQLLERRADLWETREVFPDKPQLVIGAPSSNLADLTWRGGQTKIWANTKP